MALVERLKTRLFQSTLPARGATGCEMWLEQYLTISIHAPRTGSDINGLNAAFNQCAFQSTLPARGATGAERLSNQTGRISIHAPRTGSDGRIRLGELTDEISIHAPRTGSDVPQ